MASAQSEMTNKTEENFQNPDLSDDKELQWEETLPLRISYLPPFLIEQAQNKLNETEEVRKKSLDELRKCITGEKKLRTPLDDNFLLSFLRARKFRVKKAFKLLQNFWAFRKQNQHIYNNMDIDSVKEAIFRNFLGTLLYRDKKGCCVFIFKVGEWDPEKDSFESLVSAISGILVHAVEYPATQVAGFRAIFDFRGLSWTQMKYCTIENMLLLIRSTQFCFPGQLEGIHLIFERKFFRILWAMAYPLLPSEYRKRVFFHRDNLEGLLEHIHPSVLPQEFGGQADEFNNGKSVEIFDAYVEKGKELLSCGYID